MADNNTFILKFRRNVSGRAFNRARDLFAIAKRMFIRVNNSCLSISEIVKWLSESTNDVMQS